MSNWPAIDPFMRDEAEQAANKESMKNFYKEYVDLVRQREFAKNAIYAFDLLERIYLITGFAGSDIGTEIRGLLGRVRGEK